MSQRGQLVRLAQGERDLPCSCILLMHIAPENKFRRDLIVMSLLKNDDGRSHRLPMAPNPSAAVSGQSGKTWPAVLAEKTWRPVLRNRGLSAG